jgi:ribonuclease P protein component
VEALRRRSDFDRVFADGQRRSAHGVTVVIAASDRDRFRFGLVASKRVGGAVDRNRAKRRIRHAIVAIEPRPGVDVVLIANRATLEVRFEKLVATLAEWLGDGGPVGSIEKRTDKTPEGLIT